MTRTPQVKGLSLRNAVSSLRALEGELAVERALLSLPPELGNLFRQGQILVGSWYPVSFNSALLRAIDETTPRGREFMRRLGSHSMKQDMSGVYHAFARLLGPDRCLKVSTRLYGRYYDTGQAQIIESRAGYALARWDGCSGFDSRIFQVMMGSCESLLECVGGQDVRAHIRAGGRNGDEFCEIAAFWR